MKASIITAPFVLLMVKSAFASPDILSSEPSDKRYIKITVSQDAHGRPARVGFCLHEDDSNECSQIGKFSSYSLKSLRQQRKIEFAKMTGKGTAIVAAGLLGGWAVGGAPYGAEFLLAMEAGADLFPSVGSLAIPVILGGTTASYSADLWFSYIDPISNYKKARILKEKVITDVDVYDNISQSVNFLEDVLNSIK
jgi:hypothetical protein